MQCRQQCQPRLLLPNCHCRPPLQRPAPVHGRRLGMAGGWQQQAVGDSRRLVIQVITAGREGGVGKMMISF